MKPRELPVSFYELSVKASFRNMPDVSPVPPPVMDLLTLCYSADRRPRTEGAVRCSVEDWRHHSSGQQSILINRANQDTTDVALVNFPTGARRQAQKTVDEGVEYSIHVLIVPPRVANKSALVLATGGGGLSRDQLARILNQLLTTVRKDPAHEELFKRAHPSGEAGKHVQLQCHFELLAHQSRLFSDILHQGHLNEVELIQNDHRSLDQHFIQKAHTVRLLVAQEGQSLTMAMFRRAIQTSKVEPDHLLIKFHDPDIGGMATKTLAMNELEKALTKRDVITFDTDISPCYTSINPRIIGRMRELVQG